MQYEPLSFQDQVFYCTLCGCIVAVASFDRHSKICPGVDHNRKANNEESNRDTRLPYPTHWDICDIQRDSDTYPGGY